MPSPYHGIYVSFLEYLWYSRTYQIILIKITPVSKILTVLEQVHVNYIFISDGLLLFMCILTNR